MEGLDEVLSNLNREVLAIEGRTRAGILAAGLFVEAEAVKLAPVDTGNLRGSASTRMVEDMAAEVAFEADYAIPVHEIDKVYNRGQWKYLQTAIDDNRERILEIIAERVRA